MVQPYEESKHSYPVKPSDGDLVLGGNKENLSPQFGIHKHEGVQKEGGLGGNIQQKHAPLPQGQTTFHQGNL